MEDILRYESVLPQTIRIVFLEMEDKIVRCSVSACAERGCGYTLFPALHQFMNQYVRKMLCKHPSFSAQGV